MRNLKKFLALVLALMMAMSLMVTANAATTNVEFPDDYAADPAFEEAIDVLGGMGVFKGDEKGNFNPGASITRAETAAIIYRLITADVDDSKADLYRNIDHPFIDVTPDKWYAGYVGYLWSSGIIKGTNTAGTVFDPAGQVTGYQALAMILRAVGYDKNHEFEGGQWIYNISMIANNKGILTDVNKTNYGAAMLHNAARRDVVASLLFRTAAHVPQVVYTSAFQYQEYGMSSNANTTDGNSLIGGQKNPTLGQTWFGLTENKGVVLGNEATGEGEHITKIGFELKSDGSISNNISSVSSIDSDYPNPAYIYGNSSETSTQKKAHWTGSFKWDSGLDMFGHGVRLWYDSRDTSNIDTYAVYDQAKTSVVMAGDSSIISGGALRNAAIEPSVARRENNWKAPGLKIHKTSASDAIHGGTATDVTFFNYSFSRMDVNHWGNDSGSSWKSPVLANSGDSANGSNNEWPLYLLISNDGGYLDMVVSLDMTFTRIVQVNTTTATPSVGVLNSNIDRNNPPASNAYFGDITNDLGTTAIDTTIGTTGSTATYVNLATKNLLKTPNTARGTKVAAIEITGTTGDNNGLGGNAANAGNAKEQGNLTSKFFYQLTEPTHVVPGTVVKFDRTTQDVYLSDGSVIRKSVLSEAVDGTFSRNIDAPTVYKTYSFTLDNEGRYIYWDEPSTDSSFVYGTYIDYTTELASSTFVYPLVYVDANGQAKQQANVNKINGYTLDVGVYGGTKLNKRSTSNLGDTSGYSKGMYVGYALSDTGALMEVTHINDQNTGFYRGDVDNFGDNVIEITADALAIGAKGFGAGAGYFLTENTKIHVVNGAGMDNQTVKTYNGIKELMAGMSKVTIDATAGNTFDGKGGSYLAATSTINRATLDDSNPAWATTPATFEPYDLIYYSLGKFQYSQTYDPSAREITAVYIPADLIKFTPAVDGSLYFVGDSEGNILNAYGKDATLFTMYRNGVEENIWIAGRYDNADQTAGRYDSDAYIVANDNLGNGKNDNVFYTLIPTSDKAQDGGTIYKIDAVDNADDKVVGKYWDGTRTGSSAQYTNRYNVSPATPLTTVLYTPTTYSTQIGYLSTAPYRATWNHLYNVGSAVVKNADAYSNYTINNLNDLNNAGALADNYGIEVSVVLDNADATHQTASYIYVNNIDNP